MDVEWPPAPPEGYRPHDPDYQQPWYVTVALLGWILGVFIGPPLLVVALKGEETAVRLAYTVFQHETPNEWAKYLVWVLGMLGLLALLHEALHALCGRWFGYRSKFSIRYDGFLNISPTTLTYGEYQSRGESIAIALAPLVVLTPASILVLVVSQDFWVLGSAALICLGNSVGAVADLGSACRIVQLPAGELITQDKKGRQQYYRRVNE